MALRTSMADLNAKLRLMIGDGAGASQQFSEQQLQDELDQNRLDVRYEILQPRVTFSPTAYKYVDYYSVWGYFESDYELLGPGYVTLSPVAVELLADTAHFTFTNTGTGQLPPVFLAGKTYDLYGAAANLLEFWSAKLSLAYSFSADGASFQRQQQAEALQRLAALYRRRARPKQATMVRGDVNVSDVGGDARRDEVPADARGIPFLTGE